jgi:hypothetical protein
MELSELFDWAGAGAGWPVGGYLEMEGKIGAPTSRDGCPVVRRARDCGFTACEVLFKSGLRFSTAGGVNNVTSQALDKTMNHFQHGRKGAQINNT